MAVSYDLNSGTLTLSTKNSTYQMKADDIGTLLHTHYGAKTDLSDLSYAIHMQDRGLSGNPYEKGQTDRNYSLDQLPQEVSCFGTGDYRTSSLKITNEDGTAALRLRYTGHEITKGKYSIPGLPASYDEDGSAETLAVSMKDEESGVAVTLYYGVFSELDVITRAARIENLGPGVKYINKAGSMNLDFISGDYDLITFYGKWARERIPERTPVNHGNLSVGSVRAASSPHYNPSAILCDRMATENTGEAYGFAYVYSGDFLFEAEKDQLHQTRLVCSIHPMDFTWKLLPGESFWTPEILMTYSADGFSVISNHFHDFIRKHIVRGKWRDIRRPILINNWEGTYFNFNGDKLVAIAEDAAKLGIELFVMDDGWFGKRDDDNSGLGDWYPNEEKLGCTLKELGDRIIGTGLRFGIWFEPEAVSEDSDLYRAHPDWAMTIPGRKPNLSRNELILNFGREDVQEYILERMTDVLRSAPISYVKWDFNRSVCDKFIAALPPDQQGETAHRFVLGTYRVLDGLLKAFPDLLIEGCSSGGGRFDAGMLYYTPQIWCSDDTDPIERLKIQYGTSFIYPVNTMGAHVSASPNHQTRRTTPLRTRGVTAMSGTFGYELDLNKLTEEEKQEIRMQISIFRDLYETLEQGDYYRLTDPASETCTVWEQVSRDRRRAVVNAVYHYVTANPGRVYVRLKGLDPNKSYRLRLPEGQGQEWLPKHDRAVFEEGRTYTGRALMSRGMYIPIYHLEYQSWQIVLEEA